jgi:superfamily II DNA or RNA helicase
MAAIVLRDYQERGSGEIRFAFRVHNTVVYVLSTGGGKTFLFCYIASSAAEKGRQVMILVHRKELLLQASASLRNLGIEHGIISPHFTPDPHKLVQVASIDTLMQRVKKKELPRRSSDCRRSPSRHCR